MSSRVWSEKQTDQIREKKQQLWTAAPPVSQSSSRVTGLLPESQLTLHPQARQKQPIISQLLPVPTFPFPTMATESFSLLSKELKRSQRPTRKRGREEKGGLSVPAHSRPLVMLFTL